MLAVWTLALPAWLPHAALAPAALGLAPGSAALSPAGLAVRAPPRARARGPRAEAPFRSDGEFDYFRRPTSVTVSLAKPLGAVLEEESAGGVRVQELQEGGSAAETGLLKKGDRLMSVLGTDVSTLDLDSVMAKIIEAPPEVELTVERTLIVKKPREAVPTPTLTVKGGPTTTVPRGSVLRKSLLDSGVELYKGMSKLTNCGGAGQCNTCLVDVLEGAENLSARTKVEEMKLKKKPASYRMSCQALVNGDVTVEVP